jgi:hypothetical protein
MLPRQSSGFLLLWLCREEFLAEPDGGFFEGAAVGCRFTMNFV